jgi:hypothetical protein
MTVYLTPILMRSCFCQERENFKRVELPVAFKPRFEFRAGVETLAAKIGATDIWFNPREKRATALLKNFCKHGDMPVTFDWNLYSTMVGKM